MTNTQRHFQIGEIVEVNEFNQNDRSIGRGRIDEIICLPHYEGPVACIRIPGHPGRYLRTLKSLVEER